MSTSSTLATVREVYVWLFANSPTLAAWRGRGATLTPRLEMFAHANGPSYDITVGFFTEIPRRVPINVLPSEHVETLAALVESDIRTDGFATVRPVISGSGVLVFKHFVWDREVCV